MKGALTDRASAEAMLRDPAAFLSSNGFEVPAEQAAEFNRLLPTAAPRLTESLRTVSAGDQRQIDPFDPFDPMEPFTCDICKGSALVIAALIVAAGAVGIATLTVESAVVVSLATWAGVGTQTALLYVHTLTAVVGNGAVAVATNMCEWMGKCP